MTKPYTEWKRGDELRVTTVFPGDHFVVGQIVFHNDNVGDDCPFCTNADGSTTYAMSHEQLEFVKRRVKLGVTAQKELVDALKPFLEALRVSDSDTMSSLRNDDVVLFTTAGSWTGFRTVTLGDLRKLGKAASMLGI